MERIVWRIPESQQNKDAFKAQRNTQKVSGSGWRTGQAKTCGTKKSRINEKTGLQQLVVAHA